MMLLLLLLCSSILLSHSLLSPLSFLLFILAFFLSLISSLDYEFAALLELRPSSSNPSFGLCSRALLSSLLFIRFPALLSLFFPFWLPLSSITNLLRYLNSSSSARTMQSKSPAACSDCAFSFHPIFSSFSSLLPPLPVSPHFRSLTYYST